MNKDKILKSSYCKDCGCPIFVTQVRKNGQRCGDCDTLWKNQKQKIIEVDFERF